MRAAACKKSDWKWGFKYQAFIGYRWIDCIVGVDGFCKENFLALCNNKERIRKFVEMKKKKKVKKRPIWNGLVALAEEYNPKRKALKT